MNDGYGDFHTTQTTNAPFEIHPTIAEAMAREAYADMMDYRKKARECRLQGKRAEAKEWDRKEAAAELEWRSYVSQRGGG